MSNKNKKSVSDEVTQDDINKALSELKEEGFFSAEEAEEISNLTKSEDDEDGESSEDEDLDKAMGKKKKATNAQVEDDSEDEGDDTEDDDMEDEEEGDEGDDDSEEDDEAPEQSVAKSKKQKASTKKPIKKGKKAEQSNDDDESEDDETYYKPVKKGIYRMMKKAGDKEEYADENEYSKTKDKDGNVSFKACGKAKKATITKSDVAVSDLLADAEVRELLKKNPRLSKAISEIVDENNLLKAESDENKSVDKFSVLFKGLLGEVAALSEELKTIGSQSQGRKSATAGELERFQKAEGEKDIQKADGNSVLSMKLHKGKVLDILEKLSFKKGDDGSTMVDDEFSKALMSFELGSPLNGILVKRIERESGIKVIP